MKYDQLCSFQLLYEAYRATRKGKRDRYATAQYEACALERTEQLAHALSTKTYVPSNFEVFEVWEPKHRVVQAPAFVDKVVQHAIVDNYLYDAIVKGFIYDNYASQKGRGVHFGLNRLKGFFVDYHNKQKTTEGWVLKCDVRSFFASIDHDTLKTKLRFIVQDTDIYNLLCAYIDRTEGLALGYQTSQLFALLYLDDFDHYVKEELCIKYYGRYMDDFYLIHPDKEYLKLCLVRIAEYLKTHKLELNEKTNIFPLRNGIDFLGYRTYLNDNGKVLRKLRRSSVKRMMGKLRWWRKAYANGTITEQKIVQCWRAWDNHASHGNTYEIRRKVRGKVEEIIGHKVPATKSEKSKQRNYGGYK